MTTGALSLGDGPSDSFFVFAGANSGATLRVLGCTATGQRVTSLGTAPDYIRDTATTVPLGDFNQFIPDGAGGYYDGAQTTSPAGLSLQHIGPGGAITATGVSTTDASKSLVFAVDSKNRLITAAGAGTKLIVRRTLPDSTPDPSFVASENYGASIPAGSTNVTTMSIAMQGDDRVIVAGHINTNTPFILRYWN